MSTLNLTATPGSTFHPFPRLPRELRNKIWHRTVPLFARTILVTPLISPSGPSDAKLSVQASEPAILLSVCREARSELLDEYTALNAEGIVKEKDASPRKEISEDLTERTSEDLEDEIRHELRAQRIALMDNPNALTGEVSTAGVMYVNLEIDVLYFSVCQTCSGKVPYLPVMERVFGKEKFAEVKNKVRRLAVNTVLWAKMGATTRGDVSRWVIGEFGDLEEFILVRSETHLRVERTFDGFVKLMQTGEDGDLSLSEGVTDVMMWWFGMLEGMAKLRKKGWKLPDMVKVCDTASREVISS